MQPERWLEIHALHAPRRPALATRERALTYAELFEEARALAEGLRAKGVGPASRVALALPASEAYVVLIHALLMLGATACPLDPGDPTTVSDHDLTVESIADISSSPDRKAKDPPFLPPGDPGRSVCEITSSGTSGSPKRIRLSASNIYWSAIGSSIAMGAEALDSWLVCLPLFHVSGLMPVYRALVYGTSISLHPGFSVDSVAEDLSEGERGGISLVPTALADLLDSAPDQLRTPRVVLVGGAATPTELIQRAMRQSVRVAVTYGMTEAASQVTLLPPDEVPEGLGSVGRPLEMTRVRIESGEIQVAGPTVAQDCLDPDGWYRTGDSGHIDSDHRLWVDGRIDEMIISGGENVSPLEVEATLLEHPGISQAVVFGVDDDRWQQAINAAVVPFPEAQLSEEGLHEWCREKLPSYKVPKRFRLVDEIPLGSTGKPSRAEIAKRLKDHPR